MWAAHNMRHRDAIAVVSLNCPKCNKLFKSRFGVTQHYAKCKNTVIAGGSAEAASSSSHAPQQSGIGNRLRQVPLFAQAAAPGDAEGHAGVSCWRTVARKGRRVRAE
jgi:uncharacterized C2H2 Zn-finger protein